MTSDKNYKNRVQSVGEQSVGGSGLDEFAENMGMEGLFLLIKPCAVPVHSDVKFHEFFP